MRRTDIIISRLLNKYQPKDIRDLITLLGIKIIRKKISNGAKGKFYRSLLGDEFIYISSDVLDEHEETFILAHELGHALLHRGVGVNYCFSSNVNTYRLEREANYFAFMLILSTANIDFLELNNLSSNQMLCKLNLPKCCECFLDNLLKYKIIKN